MTTLTAESPSSAGTSLQQQASRTLIGEDFDAAWGRPPQRVAPSDDDALWTATMLGATAAEAVSRTWILLPRARTN